MIMILALLLGDPIQTAGRDGAPGPGMICRRFEITGSIMGGRRLCKTKEDWARFDSGNHDKVESINDPTKRGWGVSKGDSPLGKGD